MNLKDWKTWLTGALIVLCVVAPYIWDGYFNSHHYPIDWQAWWAFCTFGVAIAAAVIAYNEYIGHKRDIQNEARQREKDYIRQVRPYVMVRLIVERRCYFLEIKNIGKTPATDVTLNLDEQILALCTQTESVHRLLSNMLESSIRFIAPEQRFIFFICTPTEKTSYAAAGNSVQFQGDVSYKNMDNEQFAETFQLAFEDYSNSIAEEDSPLDKIRDSIVDNTNAINNQGERIAEQLSSRQSAQRYNRFSC